MLIVFCSGTKVKLSADVSFAAIYFRRYLNRGVFDWPRNKNWEALYNVSRKDLVRKRRNILNKKLQESCDIFSTPNVIETDINDEGNKTFDVIISQSVPLTKKHPLSASSLSSSCIIQTHFCIATVLVLFLFWYLFYISFFNFTLLVSQVRWKSGRQ